MTEITIIISTMTALALFFATKKALKNYRENVQTRKAREALEKILDIDLEKKDDFEQDLSLIYLDDMTILSSVEELPVDMNTAHTFLNPKEERFVSLKFVNGSKYVIVKLSEERSENFFEDSTTNINKLIEELKQKKIFQ